MTEVKPLCQETIQRFFVNADNENLVFPQIAQIEETRISADFKSFFLRSSASAICANLREFITFIK